ncbi:MAG TPA: hypothetical protein VFR32_06330 [Gaiellaceae bacterium]|nr:hypothetical protein [Gaiellaceae bacterium]
MKVRPTLLAALMAAVTMTAVAAAGHEAAKQRVAISSKLFPERTFVLTRFTGGALKGDSGKVTIDYDERRSLMREGQEVTIYDATHTLVGKRGTLTIRERIEWVVVSNENTAYGYPPGVGLSTWKVVRGTGQYTRVSGGGRGAHAGLGKPWLARQEGYLTVP